MTGKRKKLCLLLIFLTGFLSFFFKQPQQPPLLPFLLFFPLKLTDFLLTIFSIFLAGVFDEVFFIETVCRFPGFFNILVNQNIQEMKISKKKHEGL